jgi:hypothetical protein
MSMKYCGMALAKNPHEYNDRFYFIYTFKNQ